MAARKSQRVIELEAKVRELEAYREAFFCLRKGEKPVEFSSSEGASPQASAELLGASRASGGVVIAGGSSVWYATDWLLDAKKSVDPYVREVARQIERAQAEAIRNRTK